MCSSKLFSAFLLATILICGIEGVPSQRINEVKGRERTRGSIGRFAAPEDVAAYLEEYEIEASDFCNKATVAEWNYNTDLNNAEKAEASNQANLDYAAFKVKEWTDSIKDIDENTLEDPLVKRQIKFLKKIGTAALTPEELTKYNKAINDMSAIFGSAKVCPYDKKDCNLAVDAGLNLDPDLENILSTSKDFDELTYVWKAWRDATGKNMKKLYQDYVDLSNKAAEANGEKDMGDFWILNYESDTFRNDMQDVWNEVKELYQKLYGYVRFRLRVVYPKNIPEDADAPLPANILGNMWAQTWDNIYPHVVPYPDASPFDITAKLKERFPETEDGVRGMFILANDFFMSLGLEDMSMAYGEKAMILRPDDKEVICHASAWDFCDKNETDYRIKMCTKVNQGDFVTIHHELGHIQYDLNYRDLPITFREGANPGFHEAIGDVVALSVETPKHMQELGLWTPTEGSNEDETTINYLMKMALQKIAFLPFGYMIDAYRWQIFNGTIKPDSYEYNWLKMRNEFQGVIPPVTRSEEDFDAGAKYHVPGNTPYIRYFVSFILQFQIHEALCREAGHDVVNELHTCDIYQHASTAGAKFKTILEAGFSKNWQELLNEVTGKNTLDAGPIKLYFKKLIEFFDQQEELHKYSVAWKANAFEELYSGNADDETKTAAIIVGAVLGVAVLVLVLGYFLKKKICKSG